MSSRVFGSVQIFEKEWVGVNSTYEEVYFFQLGLSK